ncbi:hypothetical protein BKA56DRAFT_715233 [Ilyonectria sp. MPI-CAGE-AT-0026]|nr:hypothetical protein BKA56DRAFT_715233 [Ilyonectria sp. MPI-CAGE-AT-0026]
MRMATKTCPETGLSRSACCGQYWTMQEMRQQICLMRPLPESGPMIHMPNPAQPSSVQPAMGSIRSSLRMLTPEPCAELTNDSSRRPYALVDTLFPLRTLYGSRALLHQSANRAGHPPGVQEQRRGMADFSAVLSGSEIQERGHGVHPRPILRKNEEFPTQNHLPGPTLQLSGATQLRPVGAGQATLPSQQVRTWAAAGKSP